MLLNYLVRVVDASTIRKTPMHELHAHREVILEKAEPISISTHMVNTHNGNVYGIMRELNIPRQFWESIAYLNDIDTATRFNEYVLLVPDFQLLTDLVFSGSSSLPESTSLF